MNYHSKEGTPKSYVSDKKLYYIIHNFMVYHLRVEMVLSEVLVVFNLFKTFKLSDL